MSAVALDGSSTPVATQAPAGRFTALYVAAVFGNALATITVLTSSLATRIDHLDHAHKDGALAVVVAVAAVVALLVTPVSGRLTDRCASRRGMRRPWIAGGVAVGFAGLVVMAAAPSIWLLALGWCVAQGGYNASGAALSAVLPDQFPTAVRGRIGGFVGLATAVAPVVGTGIAVVFQPSPAGMFLVPGVIAAALTLRLAQRLPDRQLPAGTVLPRLTAGTIARSYWVSPRRFPDFGWAWLSRFLMIGAFAAIQLYLKYFLQDELHYSSDTSTGLVGVSTVVMVVFMVGASVYCGRLSDRQGRRKVFVGVAAALFGVGAVIAASAPNLAVFEVGLAVAGAALGTYLAVDLALAADVLPDQDGDAGKDLGVFTTASSVPQILMPALAPAVLAIGGGHNYRALYVVAAVFAVAGALAVRPVRGVR
ncbi:MFS transporter [Catenulispora sp. NF23]|uniref:MFS transporter n=1 Tax=Catenulispora pinistramenti TaxID=2705254 RepID=UPI001BADF2BE|nr:MFS transporter [Catenulispora pinistramenti]MBS2538047.1 MFS transporter [Catenulispora pinistramenti]